MLKIKIDVHRSYVDGPGSVAVTYGTVDPLSRVQKYGLQTTLITTMLENPGSGLYSQMIRTHPYLIRHFYVAKLS